MLGRGFCAVRASSGLPLATTSGECGTPQGRHGLANTCETSIPHPRLLGITSCEHSSGHDPAALRQTFLTYFNPTVSCSGYWDAAMSPEEHGLSDQDILEANWDPQWGDRMQELVFIGIGMDKDDIRG